jgi:hypothetical protein
MTSAPAWERFRGRSASFPQVGGEAQPSDAERRRPMFPRRSMETSRLSPRAKWIMALPLTRHLRAPSPQPGEGRKNAAPPLKTPRQRIFVFLSPACRPVSSTQVGTRQRSFVALSPPPSQCMSISRFPHCLKPAHARVAKKTPRSNQSPGRSVFAMSVGKSGGDTAVA